MGEIARAGRRRSPEWLRSYPPVLLTGGAIIAALALLPSTLDLPQPHPGQTLELAPVPPEDTDEPPPAGNLQAVGLARSATADGDGAPGGGGPGSGHAVPPEIPPGQGVNPGFRCVGDPPRQTEDPLSPPCVPFFDGDNFGATHQGVTAREVRVLLYIDGDVTYRNGSDAGNQRTPQYQYFDLFEPPDPANEEHLVVNGLRAWQRYFNLRFQTYGRRVHFFVYFTGCGCTPEQRRADAADNFAVVRPFAVVSDTTEGAEDEYLTEMAARGVLSFGSFELRQASFFQRFPRLVWSYLPSVEQQASSFTSYVCQKVVGRPVVMGGPELNGRPRKLGLIATEDPSHPGLLRMAELVRHEVERCGGPIEAEARFPQCCLAQSTEVPTYAQQQMAEFRRQGITTVLWAGGINGNYGKFANQNGYVPEWIVLGDGLLDTNEGIRLSQNSPAFDRHAVVITPQVLEPALEQRRCAQAYREVDRQLPRSDLWYVCPYYTNLFQLFVGIQVAGPRLSPASIDKGFHAIPQRYAGEPEVPSCFYLPGDYTCVKDAQVEYWDATGRAPESSSPGCWRAIGDPAQGSPYGSRYGPGGWPEGNIDAQIDGGEPCNGYDFPIRLF